MLVAQVVGWLPKCVCTHTHTHTSFSSRVFISLGLVCLQFCSSNIFLFGLFALLKVCFLSTLSLLLQASLEHFVSVWSGGPSCPLASLHHTGLHHATSCLTSVCCPTPFLDWRVHLALRGSVLFLLLENIELFHSI